MSTVAATNLKNASSSVNNAVTTSGGDLTNAAGVSFMGGSKNLLYNGACQIAQRNTSVASITTSAYYTADRWATGLISLGTWTQSVENDAPTGSGLRKSLRMLCTTANASPGATALNYITQTLEGQDVQRIAKGTASAQQLTLSFWVKSNVTGTYIATLEDSDNSRNISAAYTISASATWERKTITFPADSTGVLDNDNAASLKVGFGLGAGSNYTGGSLQTTWGSGYTSFLTGQVNVAAATNNYWMVTGTQLEIGPVATSFEFKSYGQELRECQRYYYRHTASSLYTPVATGLCSSTTNAVTVLPIPVTMRANPSAVEWSGNGTFVINDGSGAYTATAVSIQYGGLNGARLDWTSSAMTASRPVYVYANNSTSSYVAVTAEL